MLTGVLAGKLTNERVRGPCFVARTYDSITRHKATVGSILR